MESPLLPPDYPLLVTAAVIIEHDRVLITRRPEHKPQGDLWEFPGGKIEAGESPQNALQREIKEELGVAIEVQTIADVLYHTYDWGAVLILAYFCQISAGELQNIEVAAHHWVKLSDLHHYQLLAADKPLVERLQKPQES